jgi:hypothetical protein
LATLRSLRFRVDCPRLAFTVKYTSVKHVFVATRACPAKKLPFGVEPAYVSMLESWAERKKSLGTSPLNNGLMLRSTTVNI